MKSKTCNDLLISNFMQTLYLMNGNELFTTVEIDRYLKEIDTISELVFNFFQDNEKAKTWFETPNPLLGNTIPLDMIRMLRISKLLKFVENLLEENKL